MTDANVVNSWHSSAVQSLVMTEGEGGRRIAMLRGYNNQPTIIDVVCGVQTNPFRREYTGQPTVYATDPTPTSAVLQPYSPTQKQRGPLHPHKLVTQDLLKLSKLSVMFFVHNCCTSFSFCDLFCMFLCLGYSVL